MKTKRLLYPDILRVMATMLVILNHLPSAELHSFHTLPFSFFDRLLSFLIITDVPMFFMLSGMLLFDKEESIRELLKKRVLRMAVILWVVFTGMYVTNALVVVHHGGVPDIRLWGYLKALFSCGMDGAEFYWFLYAYISLLFMLPILRPAAKHIGRPEFILLVVLRFFLDTFMPVFNSITDMSFNDTLGITTDLSFPLVMFDGFFFGICGYYLDKKADIRKLKAKEFALLYSGCAAGMIISTLCFEEPRWHLFSWLYTFTLFLTVKKLTIRWEDKISGKDTISGKNTASEKDAASGKKIVTFASVIHFLAPLTFGIYLLDPFFKRAFYSPYSGLFGEHSANILFSLGWLIFSFTLGTVLTFITRKVFRR